MLWSTLIPSLNCPEKEKKSHAPTWQPQACSSFTLHLKHIRESGTHSAAWPCWHWCRGGHIYTCSMWEESSVQSLDSVLKSCCDSCPSTQGKKQSLPWVSRLDNSLSWVNIWVSLYCLHASMNMSVWTLACTGKSISHLCGFIDSCNLLPGCFCCFIVGVLSALSSTLMQMLLRHVRDKTVKPFQSAINVMARSSLLNGGILKGRYFKVFHWLWILPHWTIKT